MTKRAFGKEEPQITTNLVRETNLWEEWCLINLQLHIHCQIMATNDSQCGKSFINAEVCRSRC